jgi:hypothetical protein
MISAFKPGLLIIVLFSLLAVSNAPVAAQALDIERISRATVFILQGQPQEDNLFLTCVGTGTIVSRDGLILTNAHNVVPSSECAGNTLIVALNVNPGEPPVPRYQAEIVQADPGLDLALLRIARQSDGRLINPDTLNLPFVELADSNSVNLDDTITIFGYPGLADDPLTQERGTVISFIAEPSGGDRAWIKTSATIRRTMSGGGAYNQFSQLVAIATSAPVSAASPDATCVTIQDTNRDGFITDRDICIPISGPTNTLRPANFARPLLRAASLGLTVEALSMSVDMLPPSGSPRFRYLGFSPSVNEAGMPTTIIRSLPAGSTSLFLFFDYSNMTPETVYELRVTVNGIPSSTFSLSPVRWSGGRSGLWYVGSSGQPFPNGLYEFTLFIDGTATGNARLVVGAPIEAVPQFSDLVFGILDLQGNVQGNGFVLPVGATASARFLFRNMQPGTPWTAIWYYQGGEIQRTDEGTVWLSSDGDSGIKTISIQDPAGLLPGRYRLELYIDARLSAVSDFTLAGAQDGAFARIFSNAYVTTAASPAEARTAAPISTFSAGTDALYVLFDWQRIAPGTLFTVRWSVDSVLFYQLSVPWAAGESGTDFLMRLTAPGGIPDGTYRIDLFIDQRQFESVTARVGIGQLPIDQFASAAGVILRGRVIDAYTGQGMAGVSVFIVSEDFSAADFTSSWRQDQLYSSATTDLLGRFQIERPLQRNAPYSLVVIAEGYLPITADGVEVTAQNRPDDTPIEVEIVMVPG